MVVTPLEASRCAVASSMPSMVSKSSAAASTFSSLAIASVNKAARARERSSLMVSSSNASISAISASGT